MRGLGAADLITLHAKIRGQVGTRGAGCAVAHVILAIKDTESLRGDARAAQVGKGKDLSL